MFVDSIGALDMVIQRTRKKVALNAVNVVDSDYDKFMDGKPSYIHAGGIRRTGP